MQRLGTTMIRIMSYAVLKDKGPEEQMVEERIRRLRELQKMFEDAGILPVHENCMNYGGLGWRYTLRLLEGVPGLKLVYDTGNPVFTDDAALGKPGVKQSSWEFYTHVREHIAYVHIKDGKWDAANKKTIYSYPGEGDGDVKRIVADLLARGYDGGFSIEPHLGAVFHDPSVQTEADSRYRTYVEYGRRFMKLVEIAKKGA
jgi:sugar phosphate isomerase/epimerase